MSDWDRFDDDLAGALRRRAGSAGDPLSTDAAHRAVLARASTVRRRRATIAGGGTLTVLMVAGLALLTTGGEGDDALAPADTTLPGSTIPPVTVTSPPTTDPLDPSTSAVTTATTTVPGTGSTIVLTVPPPTSTIPSTSVTDSVPTTSTTSTTAPEPTTTTAPSGTPPGRYPYFSSGGSIVVDYADGALTLVSYQAVDGYAAEVEDQQSDRIRVRFENEATGDESRIECRIENGQIRADIQ